MKAVLDACVLFPTVLREILSGVAAKGLYEPLWSDRILRECDVAVLNHGDQFVDGKLFDAEGTEVPIVPDDSPEAQKISDQPASSH